MGLFVKNVRSQKEEVFFSADVFRTKKGVLPMRASVLIGFFEIYGVSAKRKGC